MSFRTEEYCASIPGLDRLFVLAISRQENYDGHTSEGIGKPERLKENLSGVDKLR